MLIHLPLQVNGTTHSPEVDPDRTLLSVLRDDLGLTGTKYGCGEGRCGACTLLVDGNLVQSCRMTVGAAAGSHILTIEGLEREGQLHPIQEAFLDAGALQCGYCTPGMVMSAFALSQSNPQPTAAEITQVMQDHICRCGSYQRIVAAIRNATQNADASPIESVPAAPERTLSVMHEGQSDPLALDAMDEGIFVAYPCPDLALRLYGEGVEPPAPEQRALQEIGPWVHIDSKGGITTYVGKAEVGQNIHTSLAQIVGEELRVPAASVRVVMGDTARTPYDIGTFGSRTTPITGPQLWRVGASARELLLDLAAVNWNVDRDTLHIEDGTVSHPASARMATYGQLASDRYILRIASDTQTLTPPAAWQVAGQSVPKSDARAFVTGQHQFTSDLAAPEMLHGKILRPPAFQATLDRFDASAAEAMAGVTVVREGDFVGVTAPDELSAQRAIEAIRASWRTTLQVSQPELFDYLKANPVELSGRQGPVQHVEGSIEQGLAEAHLTRQARYTVDYIAHVPLEPRAALAQWTGDQLTVWTGTQRPFGVRAELATAFALPETQVRVVVPDTGAGYGGKHAGDAAMEAARLAKAVGKPVKIVWTRQEEFTWAYFRPAGLIEISSGVDKEGHLTALELHNYNSGVAGLEPLYNVANRHSEFHPADSPLRQGAYRALSSTANHFARETHMDEWAHELGIDPLELRYRNLTNPRLRAVLAAAADTFGWGKRTPAPHHGFGIAAGAEKGSFVAACAEVYVNPANGQPKVLRVVEAFDGGAILNPENTRIQVEGAIVQGLGGALFESVKFANGRILNPSFAGYRVPRFGDMPIIETVLIDRKEIPSAGAGETPIIAIAPAVGNAIFQATGVRLRALPLAPHGVQK